MRFASVRGRLWLASCRSVRRPPEPTKNEISARSRSGRWPSHPVLTADNRVHLVYELVFANSSPMFVEIEKVEAVDPQGRVLRAIDGAHESDDQQYVGEPNLIPKAAAGLSSWT